VKKRSGESAVEVAGDVYAVPLLGAFGYLICEDRLTLVDAGLPGSGLLLERSVAGLGRSLGELTRIVCTHGHPDHVGGARELAGDRVDVLMHDADFAGLQVTLGDTVRRPSRGRLFAYLARTPAQVVPVADGDIIPVLGGLEVVHTPGHTPGSICLYAARDRLLFVGDVLTSRRGRVSYASRIFSDDLRAARASVQRLADRDVETIVFGHDPPWRDDANGVLGELAARASRERSGDELAAGQEGASWRT
jgi:glyoxylase-like metal-dependent hydrolase (beta-lactamase superfamily II)